MVAKVLLTPIGGKSVMETSIDTDNDHVTLHGDIKFSTCYVLQRIIILVVMCLIALIMEEEKNCWKTV